MARYGLFVLKVMALNTNKPNQLQHVACQNYQYQLKFLQVAEDSIGDSNFGNMVCNAEDSVRIFAFPHILWAYSHRPTQWYEIWQGNERVLWVRIGGTGISALPHIGALVPTTPRELTASQLCQVVLRNVFIDVSLFVSKIIQKLPDRLSQNSIGRWHMGDGRNR